MTQRALTAAEEELVQAARQGNGPAGPLLRPDNAIAPSVDSDLFTEDDLLTLVSQAVRVPIRAGKAVWVHAVTDDDALFLNAAALRDVRGKSFGSDTERAEWVLRRARAYQVICVARKSAEPGAPRVFGLDKADAVQRNLPLHVVEEIVSVSERLGRTDESERALVADFFGGARTWARTWSSESGTGLPETLQTALAEFASCASRVSARGYLVTADLDALKLLSLPGGKTE